MSENTDPTPNTEPEVVHVSADHRTQITPVQIFITMLGFLVLMGLVLYVIIHGMTLPTRTLPSPTPNIEDAIIMPDEATPEPTPQFSPMPTQTPIASPTPSPTVSATPSPTPTITPTPTDSPTPSPSPTVN
ncbi:MAG: hypothetical protein ABI758_00060 [Candidatus Woesebacteria bacterium]